jgi:hypothetical protein
MRQFILDSKRCFFPNRIDGSLTALVIVGWLMVFHTIQFNFVFFAKPLPFSVACLALFVFGLRTHRGLKELTIVSGRLTALLWASSWIYRLVLILIGFGGLNLAEFALALIIGLMVSVIFFVAGWLMSYAVLTASQIVRWVFMRTTSRPSGARAI